MTDVRDAFKRLAAVTPANERQGLADAFAQTSARGATRFGLSTDSRTGAIGLYEKVGLVVTSTWVHRAVDLAP